jgi:hypothetical protein
MGKFCSGRCLLKIQRRKFYGALYMHGNPLFFLFFLGGVNLANVLGNFLSIFFFITKLKTRSYKFFDIIYLFIYLFIYLCMYLSGFQWSIFLKCETRQTHDCQILPRPPLPPTAPPPKEIGNLNSIITHDHHNLNNYIQNLPFLYDTKSEYIPIQNPPNKKKKEKKKKSVILSNLNRRKKKPVHLIFVMSATIHDVPSVRPSTRQHHPSARIKGNRRYNQFQYYTLQVSHFLNLIFTLYYFPWQFFCII